MSGKLIQTPGTPMLSISDTSQTVFLLLQGESCLEQMFFTVMLVEASLCNLHYCCLASSVDVTEKSESAIVGFGDGV